MSNDILERVELGPERPSDVDHRTKLTTKDRIHKTKDKVADR